MKRLIIDLDNTIAITDGRDYSNLEPLPGIIEKLHEYKSQGFDIIISSSRNMRTYEGNIGKINVNTLPIIIKWLDKYNVPYDEIYVGKPWCGTEGFYVDDRAIRPDEFRSMTYDEVKLLLGIE